MTNTHIVSDVANAEPRAISISNAAISLIMPKLTSTDEQSTITANESGKRANIFSQTNSTNICKALLTASGNITAAAISFENWDNNQ
jgi:type VII secretion effector (TIGR04197 family)